MLKRLFRRHLVTILLDMDGVITDLVSGIERFFNVKRPVPWPYGDYNIRKVLGIPNLWDELPTHFWVGLSKTEEYNELLNMVKGHEVIICTSPTDTRCVEGKLFWLSQYLPDNDFVITKRKELLAKPDVLLIDDSDAKIEAFTAAGGQGILFPRPWNSCYDIVYPMEYVRNEYDKLVSG